MMIGAVGDSIVNADRSLVFWVAEATGATLARVSRGGATAAEVVGQIGRLEGRSDVVVLTVGTNDVLAGTPADTFRASLDTIVARLGEHADQIVMPTIPAALASFPGGRGVMRARVDAVNAVLRDLDGVTLIDGNVGLSVDRVHPTVDGQRELATRTLTVLGLSAGLPPIGPRERVAPSTLRTAGVLAAKSLLRRY